MKIKLTDTLQLNDLMDKAAYAKYVEENEAE